MFGIALRRSVREAEEKAADLEKRVDHLKKAVTTLTKQRDDGQRTIADLRATIQGNGKVADEDIEDAARILSAAYADLLMKRPSVAQRRIQEALDMLYDNWRNL